MMGIHSITLQIRAYIWISNSRIDASLLSRVYKQQSAVGRGICEVLNGRQSVCSLTFIQKLMVLFS